MNEEIAIEWYWEDEEDEVHRTWVIDKFQNGKEIAAYIAETYYYEGGNITRTSNNNLQIISPNKYRGLYEVYVDYLPHFYAKEAV